MSSINQNVEMERIVEATKKLESKSTFTSDNTRAAIMTIGDVVRALLVDSLARDIELLDKKMNPVLSTPAEKLPMTPSERVESVKEMLKICSNELQNKTLFPFHSSREVWMKIPGGELKIDASSLIWRILDTILENE